MKEFDVTITETLERVVTVEAESREAAEAMVRQQYDSSEIVLDSGDFTGVEFVSSQGREPSKDAPDKMTVLLISPQQYPRTVEIGTSLADIQKAVGGDIQAIYPFDEEVALVMNEEGKIQGLPLNRGLYAGDGEMYDAIAGDFLVVGLTEENFGSLSPELLTRFEEAFHQPELFVKMGKSVMAIPMPDDMVKTGMDAPDKGSASRPKAQER